MIRYASGAASWLAEACCGSAPCMTLHDTSHPPSPQQSSCCLNSKGEGRRWEIIHFQFYFYTYYLQIAGRVPLQCSAASLLERFLTEVLFCTSVRRSDLIGITKNNEIFIWIAFAVHRIVADWSPCCVVKTCCCRKCTCLNLSDTFSQIQGAGVLHLKS